MRILSAKREKPHLVRFFLDDGSDFALDLDLSNELCLKAGDTLSEEKISELMEYSDYIRAKSRAMFYLERADRTEKELYEKLKNAKFSARASAKAIARLKELGVIDDRRYAIRRIEYLAEKNTSKREIYQKLYIKGIKKELLNELLEQTEIDERAQIDALIERKYAKALSEARDRNDIQKIFSSLARKGFSFGTIRDALKQYSEELKYLSEEN